MMAARAITTIYGCVGWDMCGTSVGLAPGGNTFQADRLHHGVTLYGDQAHKIGTAPVQVWYNASRGTVRVIRKGELSMPTSEERLTALEQAQAKYSEAIDDLNHHVTILTGVISKQGWDIREIKSSLRAFEQSVTSRFDALEGRLGTLEQSVTSRFDVLEGRLGTLEQSVNSRFGTLEQSITSRFEAQDKKFDQILLLLNTFVPKPEQET